MIWLRKSLSFALLLALFCILASTTRSISACTIFTVSKGNKAFFGNNEDWYDPDTYIWFEQPKEGKYGGVFLGFGNYFPQGGMNEKGLCFDANALPEMPLDNHPELPYSQEWIVKQIIDECADISEALQLAKEFNWGTSMAYQVHLADALGNAVVISPGTDGELNFTRKNVGDGFLVSTNFNVGYPRNGWTPCWRYPIASEMLDSIDHEDNLTLEILRDILDATHQEGTYATKYSNIFDLVLRDIYIYQNFNYTNVVKLNLEEELAKGKEEYTPISDLFSHITNGLGLTATTSDIMTSVSSLTSSQVTLPQRTIGTPLYFLFLSILVLILIRRRH
ncbi:MAG: hypothetical protein ACFE9A_04680 [Candidatus Hodarchaeota archaeon]